MWWYFRSKAKEKKKRFPTPKSVGKTNAQTLAERWLERRMGSFQNQTQTTTKRRQTRRKRNPISSHPVCLQSRRSIDSTPLVGPISHRVRPSNRSTNSIEVDSVLSATNPPIYQSTVDELVRKDLRESDPWWHDDLCRGGNWQIYDVADDDWLGTSRRRRCETDADARGHSAAAGR